MCSFILTGKLCEVENYTGQQKKTRSSKTFQNVYIFRCGMVFQTRCRFFLRTKVYSDLSNTSDACISHKTSPSLDLENAKLHDFRNLKTIFVEAIWF